MVNFPFFGYANFEPAQMYNVLQWWTVWRQSQYLPLLLMCVACTTTETRALNWSIRSVCTVWYSHIYTSPYRRCVHTHCSWSLSMLCTRATFPCILNWEIDMTMLTLHVSFLLLHFWWHDNTTSLFAIVHQQWGCCCIWSGKTIQEQKQICQHLPMWGENYLKVAYFS